MKSLFKTGQEAGFTMVELIVAIVISAIMIGAVNLVLINQTHLSQQNRDLVLANAYVEGKIESLRSAGFKSLNVGATDVTAELPAELSPPRTGTVTISTLDAATKKVDVSVTYNDQGKNRNYAYTTYVGELGVGQY